MPDLFEVAANGSIMSEDKHRIRGIVPSGTRFEKGEEIKCSVNGSHKVYPPLTGQQIQEHLNSGYLKLVRAGDIPADPEERTPDIPGIVDNPPLPPIKQNTNDHEEEKSGVSITDGEMNHTHYKIPKSDTKSEYIPSSQWDGINPSKLKNQKLVAINAIIMERENVKPFKNKSKALDYIREKVKKG